MLSTPASLGLPAFADSSTVFKIAVRARSCRSFASQTAVAARAAESSAISADGDMFLLALRPAHITFRHEECAHEEKMQHWSRPLYNASCLILRDKGSGGNEKLPAFPSVTRTGGRSARVSTLSDSSSISQPTAHPHPPILHLSGEHLKHPAFFPIAVSK
jgi:hypothetical protein